ncbi:MAG: hypothetical protein AAF736_16065 [Pseudomonadota bacterium]
MNDMRRLMILMCLTLAACATTRHSGQENGFQVGNLYQSRTTLFAVTWGKRTELVSSYRPGAGKARPSQVIALAAGTQITVALVRGDNTLTRGIDEWPEGRVLGGAHDGMKVSLAMPGLREYFLIAE